MSTTAQKYGTSPPNSKAKLFVGNKNYNHTQNRGEQSSHRPKHTQPLDLGVDLTPLYTSNSKAQRQLMQGGGQATADKIHAELGNGAVHFDEPVLSIDQRTNDLSFSVTITTCTFVSIEVARDHHPLTGGLPRHTHSRCYDVTETLDRLHAQLSTPSR